MLLTGSSLRWRLRQDAIMTTSSTRRRRNDERRTRNRCHDDDTGGPPKGHPRSPRQGNPRSSLDTCPLQRHAKRAELQGLRDPVIEDMPTDPRCRRRFSVVLTASGEGQEPWLVLFMNRLLAIPSETLDCWYDLLPTDLDFWAPPAIIPAITRRPPPRMAVSFVCGSRNS